MKILQIDHIGIAAKSIEQVTPFWSAILGLPITGRETVAEQKATTAFLPVGESEIEILESTAPEGAIAKFIESRGEGIQHIALRVENIEEALKELKERGFASSTKNPGGGRAEPRSRSSTPRRPTGYFWKSASAEKERKSESEDDEFVKSRHSGGNRSPENLTLFEKTGFRLSPE